MKHFHQIAGAVDVMPLLHAVQRQPHLWNKNDKRTTFENTPHGEVDDIWLRFNRNVDGPLKELGDDLEAVNYPAMERLPQVRPILFDLMRRLEAERLGRVLITRLHPGGRILPHADVLGEYSQYYNRYHVVLQGLPGSLFHAGDETVTMQTGSVWWFDAHAMHSCENNSTDDRVHLLVDIRITP